MVIVRNRYQKWKAHDEISKIFSFDFTDVKVRHFMVILMFKIKITKTYGKKSCWVASFANPAYKSLIYNFQQGGLAATFDLAAFGLYMIAPVKKSVNHSKTLTSMREVQRSLPRTTREYVFFCSW